MLASFSMWRTSEVAVSLTPLTRAIPKAEFRETHRRLIQAEPTRVWEALNRMTLADLPLTGILMRVRQGRDDDSYVPLLTGGPVPATLLDPPAYAAGVTAGRPWKRTPSKVPGLTLETAANFSEPGWLVYGTEFRLTAVGADACLVQTHTRCHPTSWDANRAFRLYWTGIRVFSGLVRREMLWTLARMAQ